LRRPSTIGFDQRWGLPMDRRRLVFLMAASAVAVPLGAQPNSAAAWLDDTWLDPRRQRAVPVRMRWPAGDGPCGLVFHSRGLGGDRGAGALWGEAWRAAGLAVVHLQHPGSDSEVWRNGLPGLWRGAAVEQYLARVQDAHFALDELQRLRERGGRWSRVRLDAVGFAGTRSVPA